MISNMSTMFSKMIGTLAVILLVAAFIGGSDVISRLLKTKKKWLYSIIMGVLGGMEGMKYRENIVRLTEGDVVYLYTDGVTEAEDKDHNLFGENACSAVSGTGAEAARPI